MLGKAYSPLDVGLTEMRSTPGHLLDKLVGSDAAYNISYSLHENKRLMILYFTKHISINVSLLG